MDCARRIVLFLLLVASVSFHGAVSVAKEARPNIVVILADDLGWGDLSCYGSQDVRTPNIDALAERGIRFERFYASCTVCSPTRAAFLTGRYPDTVGVPGVIRTHAADNWGHLSPSVKMLPAVLAAADYHTALVGKWHLGLASPNLPNERGFQFFHGFLGDMMDDYQSHRRHDINYIRRDTAEIDPPGHATDLFTRWACDYIHQRAGEQQPFFLYLAYNAPHSPVQPPDAFLRRVQQRAPNLDARRAKLIALIEHMDDGVGQVVRALQESGELDNTLIMFSSDNGGDLPQGASNGPWRAGKGDMYEGGLRVPFCAAWPAHIPAGQQSSAVGITMDLFPTVCDAAGVRDEESTTGISLLPVLRAQSQQTPPRELYWTRREGGLVFSGNTSHALLQGDWKIVWNTPRDPLELFNLTADPYEKTDLAQSEPAKLRELAALLQLHIQRAGEVPWQPPAK